MAISLRYGKDKSIQLRIFTLTVKVITEVPEQADQNSSTDFKKRTVFQCLNIFKM